jgi:hypothetical protein
MSLGMPYACRLKSSCSRKTRREREGNVAKKHKRGLVKVFVAVLDVGEEGVDRVKGLASAEASALGGRE